MNQANKNEATPLSIACQEGHMDLVMCLVEAGAGLNQAKKHRFTPLYMASHLDVVRCHREAGVDLKASSCSCSCSSHSWLLLTAATAAATA